MIYKMFKIMKFNIQNINANMMSNILIYGKQNMGKSILTKHILNKSNIDKGNVFSLFTEHINREYKTLKNVNKINNIILSNYKQKLSTIIDISSKKELNYYNDKSFNVYDSSCLLTHEINNKDFINLLISNKNNNIMSIIETNNINAIIYKKYKKFDYIFIFDDNNDELYKYLQFMLKNTITDYSIIKSIFKIYSDINNFRCLVIDNKKYLDYIENKDNSKNIEDFIFWYKVKTPIF